MKNLFCVSIAFLFLVFNFQSVYTQKSKKRNLVRYDNGGKFDFNWGVESQKREIEKQKLREFLWTHWKEKKSGRAVAMFYSIEGDPTTVSFYVQPDKDGNWVVFMKAVNICCALDFMMKKKRTPTIRKWEVSYKIIERIEISPPFNVPKTKFYLLRFSGNGKENEVSASFTL